MGVVNKRQLAHLLGISIPTLDLALMRDKDFPVVSRGTSGREWRFDEDQVVAFMAAKRAAAEAERQAREAQLRDLASVARAASLFPIRGRAGRP